MTYYMFLADRHGSNTGARWGVMGITIKVAQSVSDYVHGTGVIH